MHAHRQRNSHVRLTDPGEAAEPSPFAVPSCQFVTRGQQPDVSQRRRAASTEPALHKVVITFDEDTK